MRTLVESKVLSFLFLALIRWNEKGGESKISFCYLPQGFESFPSDLPRARGRNLARVECLQTIKPWWLVFVLLGLMLLWVMGEGFENICTVSGK